jgi:V-type H+-transporting ATPase subunit a
MSQFRSEAMELLQIFMARDAAHDTLKELGDLGALQFKDLNHDKSSFNRPHVLEVRKCDDMLRIMRYLGEVCANEKMAKKKHISAVPGPPHGLDDLHERLHELEKEVKVRRHFFFIHHEVQIDTNLIDVKT